MASYTAQQAEAALKSQFETYGKAVDNEKWDIVFKDKESVYGKKDITAYLAKFAEVTGKSVTTVTNAKYEGAGDYLIVTADFSSQTEKAGTFKGKFVQIWKKEGDRHLIYHDEFEPTA